MGAQSVEVASRIIEKFGLNVTIEGYLKRFFSLIEEVMSTAELLPGVKRLLRHLHDHKVPMALATSSKKESYDIKTSRHTKLFELFDHKACGSSDDEVFNGKPAPDIFIVAARRFPDKPHPSQCLVFEDAPNGVRAANAAGCQCVLVPEDYVTAEMRKEATLVIDSLEDFRPELFGLPPFDK